MKIIHTILGALVSLILITSFILYGSINANAHEDALWTDVIQYVKVNSVEGLNVRDENCNWIGILKDNQILLFNKIEHENQFSELICNLGGINYDMINISNNTISKGYVARKYVQDVLTTEFQNHDTETGRIDFYTDSLTGLNVRNENCSKIGAIRHKDILRLNYNLSENFKGNLYSFDTSREINCYLGGKNYTMKEFYIPYLNKTGFVALEFVN